MSDIKTVYKDKSGNEHATRGKATKANRLIDSTKSICEIAETDGQKEGDNWEEHVKAYSYLDVSSFDGKPWKSAVVEYARAVVAIYGMKDKPTPKSEEPAT